MANEIQATFSLKVLNGNFKDYVNSETWNITQSTAGGDAVVVSVPTTAGGTAISFPDVSTYGYAFIRNIDATNFVTFGPTSGGAMVTFGKLKPGEFAWVRLTPGITLRVLADTATCLVQIKLLQD